MHQALNTQRQDGAKSELPLSLDWILICLPAIAMLDIIRGHVWVSPSLQTSRDRQCKRWFGSLPTSISYLLIQRHQSSRVDAGSDHTKHELEVPGLDSGVALAAGSCRAADHNPKDLYNSPFVLIVLIVIGQAHPGGREWWFLSVWYSHDIRTLKLPKSGAQSSLNLRQSKSWRPKCRKSSKPLTPWPVIAASIIALLHPITVHEVPSYTVKASNTSTLLPSLGPAASISDFIPPSACLRPERNQGPSQCTRQTDKMAAGLKTIIALSFVWFDLSALISPSIHIFGALIPTNYDLPFPRSSP